MAKSNNRIIQVDLNADGSLVYTEKSQGDGHKRHSHRDSEDLYQWTSNLGSLEIRFSGEHPFHEHPAKAEAGQLTPAVRVRKGAKVGDYKYDVTLIEKNGRKHHDDPVIVIHEDADFADPGLEN